MHVIVVLTLLLAAEAGDLRYCVAFCLNPIGFAPINGLWRKVFVKALPTLINVFVKALPKMRKTYRGLREFLSYNNLVSVVDVDARLGGAVGVLAALHVVPVF